MIAGWMKPLVAAIIMPLSSVIPLAIVGIALRDGKEGERVGEQDAQAEPAAPSVPLESGARV